MNEREKQQEKPVPLEKEVEREAAVSEERENALRELWLACSQTANEEELLVRHLPDALLYDFALGVFSAEEQGEARAHLAVCHGCRHELSELQEVIAEDKKVGAVWIPPKDFQAAGGVQELSVIKAVTEDGKYEIILQPLRGRQEDLLTLEVMSPYQEQLEDQNVILVSREGRRIIRGTIANGTITRRVDQKFRDEWPFYVHAG